MTFTPFHHVEEAGAHNPASDAIILVAEDDHISRFLMITLLEKFGYKVISATNGKIAVEVFNTHPTIKIVLMDIKMPVMDGYEATKQIKNISRGTPVIAVTAYAREDNEACFIEAGFDDFLSKPLNQSELLSKFEKFHIHLKKHMQT